MATDAGRGGADGARRHRCAARVAPRRGSRRARHRRGRRGLGAAAVPRVCTAWSPSARSRARSSPSPQGCCSAPSAGLMLTLTGDGAVGRRGVLAGPRGRSGGRGAVRAAPPPSRGCARGSSSAGSLAMLSLRLIPVLPFSVVNYPSALSGVRFLPYAGRHASWACFPAPPRSSCSATRRWAATRRPRCWSCRWPAPRGARRARPGGPALGRPGGGAQQGCRRRESNPHCRVPKTRPSAVGVRRHPLARR